MIKKIRKTFISGLLILIPIALTFTLIFWFISKTDSILRTPITSLLGTYIPGLGILTLLLVIFLTGLLTNNLLGRWIMKKVNNILTSLPLIKSIYGSILQILQTFTSSSNKSFSKVVMVPFPSQHTKSIGFITNDNVTVSGQQMASVFIPTTPNPSNGFLILVAPDDYEEIDMPVDQALKVVVSLGTLIPSHLKISTDETTSRSDDRNPSKS